jgi:hypothetical protein
MGTGGAISTGQVKMDVLHSAVHQFVNAWKLDLPLGSADDRLGVVVFESAGAATTRALTLGGSFFVPRATWDSIPTAVDLITPGGDTALGDGINEAIRQWNLDPKNDLNLVVMTNGIQNDGNQIVPDVMIPSLWDLAGPVPGSTPEPLINRKIPIQTIGVGAPDSVQSGLLDGIAMQTGGTAQLKTVTTLDTGFLATLVSILKGNTLSIVSQEENTLGAGVSASAPTAVDLNVSIKRAIVVLGWFGAANAGALGLQIFPPSGTTPIIPAAKEDGAFSTVQAIDLPANGPAGEWTLKVIRSGPSTAPVFYHLTVLAADGRFTYRMDFAKAQPATGDPLILRMELGENGTPLTSLGGAIQVRIERPQTALGTALRNLQVASTVLTTNPAGFTPDSFPNPYERKLFNFLSNPLLGDLIRPTLDPNTFTMFDDGRPEHGDDKAGDGVYSMRYDKTSTPGIYKFRVTLDSNTVSLGKLHRYEERETLVAVRVADPKQSETAVSKEPAPGAYRLDIVPADRFGNFLGPGYADFIKVTLTGGGTVNPTVTDERENGTYTLHITGVPTGANPTVSVKVIGIEIAGGTLTTLSKPNKKFAFFGGVGLNFPHGVFNTFYNSGLSTQLGFEYRFTNRVSAEGTFGYDRFKFAFGGGHQSLVRASGNLKVYPVIGTYQLGFFGGGGIYHFTSGTTRGGVNIGVVNEFRITTSLSLEGTYNFHNVFTAGASTRFSTLQGGFRFRF